MQRCLLPYFAFGETGRSLFETNELAGNSIEIGIRAMDYIASGQSTLKTLAKGDDLNLGMVDFKQTDKGVSWVFKGIPIKITVVKRKYEFLRNPSSIYYFGETYNLPNPFNKYFKARYIVQ